MNVIAENKQALPQTGNGKWLALAALMVAQFMVVIDIIGLNVALPSIQHSLHFLNSSLEWVMSAYQIAFGGCLLLGGRIADLFGRKRIFLIGAAAFATTSLLCGWPRQHSR
ncbi:Major Facilitator Superfamily protein [Paenibacillus sp. UNC496MF]|nr:MFS transporter [Paenibacillus sp. UNC496MF]SFJ77313.1 Major Facilitator Superfamily protein [Paenibacillus sp. UNC496MF]